MQDTNDTIVLCSCCKGKIRPYESTYKIEICRQTNPNDKEIILDVVCDDCFHDIKHLITFAEKRRLGYLGL